MSRQPTRNDVIGLAIALGVSLLLWTACGAVVLAIYDRFGGGR